MLNTAHQIATLNSASRSPANSNQSGMKAIISTLIASSSPPPR